MLPTIAAAGAGALLASCVMRFLRRRTPQRDAGPANQTVQLASMVYRYSEEAMVVTDADNRIVAVNPAFTRLTGYSEEEVLGRNPRFLSSGRQDRGFYARMWQTLNKTGRWQGQIVNRRKNGEEFVEKLTLHAIFDENRCVCRYVALFSDITERMQFDDLLWKQANFDMLTQLPNRRMARERLEQEIRAAHRSDDAVALLLIDLDRFKEVNDTLGHACGDLLLMEAARRIGACIGEWDTLARSGGDEFTVILSGLPAQEHARIERVERIAQAIMRALSDPFLLGDKKVYSTGSIGISRYPEDGGNAEDLQRNANQALYEAKKAGRTRASYFRPAMKEATQAHLMLISEMHQALAEGQFELAFQPVVDLASGRIRKAEALLRWRHPERGMISPASFVPVAEETGLIVPLGDWVFREAARWARRWNGLCADDFQVSVNVSPAQFHADEDIAAAWTAYCRELGLAPDRLVIEITEGLLLKGEPHIAAKLEAMRAAGMQIAIDDFGTGYSALSYIKAFTVDYLKIDQTFIRGLETDSRDLCLSEAIIAMSHKLGLNVIAEGVETPMQKSLLAAAGCNYGQGYLFSKPVGAGEFEALLLADVGALIRAA